VNSPRRGPVFAPRPHSFGLALLLLAAMPLPLAAEESKGVESKPLRDTVPDYTVDAEQAQVERLQSMLRAYHSEQAEAVLTDPTAEEVAQRLQAEQDAAHMARIPYNVDKVRLSGEEGSMALAEITRRLSNPAIPESRRDNAPICSFRTYLFGRLIAGEKRSLRAVGKHHFVLKQQLQPGNTTVRISGHSWEVRIPEDSHSQEYLITLYKPPGVKPQFHVFPVAELVATQNAHIPAWLPEELQIQRPG
jgi:hypothetical protein